MDLENKNIGFVLTGSFCTFSKVIPKIKKLVELGANVIPIMSYNAYNLDTKFGNASDFIKEIEEIIQIGMAKKEIIQGDAAVIASGIFGLTCSSLIYKMKIEEELDIDKLYQEFDHALISGLRKEQKSRFRNNDK